MALPYLDSWGFAACIACLACNDLLPPLDEVLALLAEPTAALQAVVDAVGSIARYVEIDPAYFAKNQAAPAHVFATACKGLQAAPGSAYCR